MKKAKKKVVDTGLTSSWVILSEEEQEAYVKQLKVILGHTMSTETLYEEFKVNYSKKGEISSISNRSSGISNITVETALTGEVTIYFIGYDTPPLQMIFYGYAYTSNTYFINTITSFRQVPGGGSSGKPTAFGSFSQLQLKVGEYETGASRSKQSGTHAWVRFVMAK